MHAALAMRMQLHHTWVAGGGSRQMFPGGEKAAVNGHDVPVDHARLLAEEEDDPARDILGLRESGQRSQSLA